MSAARRGFFFCQQPTRKRLRTRNWQGKRSRVGVAQFRCWRETPPLPGETPPPAPFSAPLSLARADQKFTVAKCRVVFGSFWGRFGVVFGSFLGRFWVVFGSFLGRFGVFGRFWSFLGRFWVVFGSFLGRFWVAENLSKVPVIWPWIFRGGVWESTGGPEFSLRPGRVCARDCAPDPWAKPPLSVRRCFVFGALRGTCLHGLRNKTSIQASIPWQGNAGPHHTAHKLLVFGVSAVLAGFKTIGVGRCLLTLIVEVAGDVPNLPISARRKLSIPKSCILTIVERDSPDRGEE